MLDKLQNTIFGTIDQQLQENGFTLYVQLTTVQQNLFHNNNGRHRTNRVPQQGNIPSVATRVVVLIVQTLGYIHTTLAWFVFAHLQIKVIGAEVSRIYRICE
jgi:hypothetical protein